MGKRKPLSELGQVMDRLASGRHVRGPYIIAEYIKEKMGHSPSGQSISGWLYGEMRPSEENIRLFAEAFELETWEREVLIWTHVYKFEPPHPNLSRLGIYPAA